MTFTIAGSAKFSTTAIAFRLTASAKATAGLAEALRAKAEAGSHISRVWLRETFHRFNSQRHYLIVSSS